VGRPATQLVEFSNQFQPRCSAGHHEQRLAAVSEFLVDDRVHHMHVGDAAVADPHLVAIDDPVVTVAARASAQIPNVAAALGLGDRQGGELDIAWGSETFGRPLEHLLRRRGLTDRRQRQRGHDDRQSDSGAAPEELLHNIGSEMPVGSPIRSR